jgi:hypothetical protein
MRRDTSGACTTRCSRKSTPPASRRSETWLSGEQAREDRLAAPEGDRIIAQRGLELFVEHLEQGSNIHRQDLGSQVAAGVFWERVCHDSAFLPSWTAGPRDLPPPVVSRVDGTAAAAARAEFVREIVEAATAGASRAPGARRSVASPGEAAHGVVLGINPCHRGTYK